MFLEMYHTFAIQKKQQNKGKKKKTRMCLNSPVVRISIKSQWFLEMYELQNIYKPNAFHLNPAIYTHNM